MNKVINNLINEIRAEGKDYTDFGTLFSKLIENNVELSKDDLLNFLSNDYRLQLNTTPNTIANIISGIVRDDVFKNVIDICCGTGNILYHLKAQISDLTGVEINRNVSEITKYILPQANIINDDTFKYPFTKKYDLVVGHLPYGTMFDNEGKKIKIEEAFIRKAFELCKKNGKIIIIAPYSVLSNNSFRQLRQDYQKNLQIILGLPISSIQYSAVKSAIICFNSQINTEIKIGLYHSITNLNEPYKNQIQKTLINTEVSERWDPEFFIQGGSEIIQDLDSFSTQSLSNLAEVFTGKHIKEEELNNVSGYLYLKPIHIQNDMILPEKALKFLGEKSLKASDSRIIIQPGDILISNIFNDLKLHFYKTGDPLSIASSSITIIRSSKSDYIQSYLQSEEGKLIFINQTKKIRKGVIIPHLNISDIRNIKIPILPTDDLNRFGNNAIQNATSKELEVMLEELKDCKIQLNVYASEIDKLANENAELKSNRAFLENRFDRIDNQLLKVHRKLDTIIENLKEIITGFKDIKKLPREVDERIFKQYQLIDDKLSKLLQQDIPTINNYIEEIKRWLYHWEILDIESQKFLPIAEFIFDKLSILSEADYSPFIVQYCRALENEILKKIFESYHQLGLTGTNVDELINDDLTNEKTGKFANMVKKNNFKYTLGDMNFIMSLLKENGNTLKNSKLLKHFKGFVNSYFNNQILETEFLTDLKYTTEYRNEAAHPHVISLDRAILCQKLLRKILNMFLESKK